MPSCSVWTRRPGFAEFRQDTADVCDFVQNRGSQAVADIVINVLGLLDPTVADVADIIAGALRMLCGLRPSWLARHGWWSIPAARDGRRRDCGLP